MTKIIKLSALLILMILIIDIKSAGNSACNVIECSTCANPQYCDVCTGSLKPTTNHLQCISCAVDSCSYCNVTDSCQICYAGFKLWKNDGLNATLGTGNLCFKCDITFCQSCNANDTCQTCVTGYTLIQNKCKICSFPCKTCNYDMTCASCQIPIYFKTPNATGQCFQHTVAQCTQYDLNQNSICLACQTGYTINSTSNTCKKVCTYPCLECSTTACTKCTERFYPNAAGVCTACPFGCLSCNDTSCITAAAGFYLNGSTSIMCPSFCSTCSSGISCLTYQIQYIGYLAFSFNATFSLVACPFGCLSCEFSNNNLRCLIPLPGFYLLQGLCTKCSGNCKTCDMANTSKCLTCFDKAILNSNFQCVSCDAICLTCQDANNLAVCTSCPDGSFLNGTTCIKGCPANCQSCSSSTECTICQSGFTPSVDSQTGGISCLQCVTTCRYCSPGQPSQCTLCGDGAYLVGTQCKFCPKNCKQCDSAGCFDCYNGFKINSDRTCTSICIQPCSTCGKDPNLCTSCLLGYSLNALTGKCTAVSNCTTGSCVFCPYGYSLFNNTCILCKGIGCRTCDTSNLSKCTSCISGYFMNSLQSTCVICPESCINCISLTSCSQCAVGYLSLPNTLNLDGGYTCLKCASECTSCLGSQSMCASCGTEYQLDGWKCVKKQRFRFGCSLFGFLGFFFSQIFFFMRALCFGIGGGIGAIAFSSIRSGSVIIDGSVSPSSSDPNDPVFQNELNSFTNTITSGDIGGLTVESSSFSLTIPTVQAKSNLGLILGICIPSGILIIAGVIYAVYKIRARKNQYEQSNKKHLQHIQSNNTSVNSQKIQF